MSNYRSDQLVSIIQTIDRRTNQAEDPIESAQNTIEDLFFWVREKLTLSDTVETPLYTPSTFVWGNGTTIAANWEWNYGGRWSS